MALDAAAPMSRRPTVGDGSTQLDEDTVWQKNLRSNGSAEAGTYPERPGEQDCAYYVRTGLCRFGMTCRYNHPPNRKLAIAAARLKGGYPERVGQPECQYYLKTGTCKFGPACKFHHPRDKAGIVGRVLLNSLGYPLRPNEPECAYYLRTGQCKFGNTCKFHHPQPSSSTITLSGSSVYPSVNSPTTSGQQSAYSGGGMTNWSLSRASFIASSRWQGHSSYAQLVLPQGVVPVPSWNAAYAGELGTVSPSESQQQTLGIYTLRRESVFPERPDQPECQFYMKTGDCKFGAVCKFHHPKERLIPLPNCLLSPLGLPLRPGEPSCIFYTRYGICKFGPNCKFDHPLGTFTYGLSPSALTDVPVVHRMLGSSSGTLEAASGKSKRVSRQESRHTSIEDEDIDDESVEPVSSFA